MSLGAENRGMRPAYTSEISKCVGPVLKDGSQSRECRRNSITEHKGKARKLRGRGV